MSGVSENTARILGLYDPRVQKLRAARKEMAPKDDQERLTREMVANSVRRPPPWVRLATDRGV